MRSDSGFAILFDLLESQLWIQQPSHCLVVHLFAAFVNYESLWQLQTDLHGFHDFDVVFEKFLVDQFECGFELFAHLLRNKLLLLRVIRMSKIHSLFLIILCLFI